MTHMGGASPPCLVKQKIHRRKSLNTKDLRTPPPCRRKSLNTKGLRVKRNFFFNLRVALLSDCSIVIGNEGRSSKKEGIAIFHFPQGGEGKQA